MLRKVCIRADALDQTVHSARCRHLQGEELADAKWLSQDGSPISSSIDDFPCQS